MNKFIKFIIILLLMIGLITLYSRFVEPYKLIVNEYKVITNIIDDYHGLKIVQISDIHYGRTTNIKEIKRLVKEINLTKPDILVFTGDMFEDNNKITEDVIKEFKKIQTSIGKYAVNGPSDLKNNYKEVMEKMDFKIIDDTYDVIYSNSLKPIIITGLSTSYKSSVNTKDKINPIIEEINNMEEKPIYSILILHDADQINNIDLKYFNLILSSNEQAGQIIVPFIGEISKSKNNIDYFKEFYQIDKTKLYLSNGIGTSNYSFRLLNKPSFNLYRIVNK